MGLQDARRLYQDGGAARHHDLLRADPRVGRVRVHGAHQAARRAARRVGRRPDLHRPRRAVGDGERRRGRVRRDHLDARRPARGEGRQRRGRRAALPVGDDGGRDLLRRVGDRRPPVHHADRGVGDGRLLLRARRRDRDVAAPPVRDRPRRVEGGRRARVHDHHHADGDAGDGVRAEDPAQGGEAAAVVAPRDPLGRPHRVRDRAERAVPADVRRALGGARDRHGRRPPPPRRRAVADRLRRARRPPARERGGAAVGGAARALGARPRAQGRRAARRHLAQPLAHDRHRVLGRARGAARGDDVPHRRHRRRDAVHADVPVPLLHQLRLHQLQHVEAHRRPRRARRHPAAGEWAATLTTTTISIPTAASTPLNSLTSPSCCRASSSRSRG